MDSAGWAPAHPFLERCALTDELVETPATLAHSHGCGSSCHGGSLGDGYAYDVDRESAADHDNDSNNDDRVLGRTRIRFGWPAVRRSHPEG